MAKTLTCACGQVLDVEGFSAGDQVQCPGCEAVLAVPAEAVAQTPVAMAMAVDDEDDEPEAPVGGGSTVQQYLNPMERRRRAQQRTDYAAQAKLKKVMIWPCLVLGLAALGVAVLGFYWAFMVEPKIQIVEEGGVATLYARVETVPGSGEFERIEVRPDIQPGDSVAYDDESPVITLGGEKAQFQGGVLRIFVDGDFVPVRQSGFWFYKFDPATGKFGDKLDLPLVGQVVVRSPDPKEEPQREYKRVSLKGTDFYLPGGSQPVNVAFYRAEDQYMTTPLGKFKMSSTFLDLSPAFFILSGIPIGVILLLAGGFFAYEAYFSKAAKAARAKKEAEEAVQQQAPQG